MEIELMRSLAVSSVIAAVGWGASYAGVPNVLAQGIGLPEGIDFGSITATSILGWYAWHTASRTIPSMVSEHRADNAAARKEYMDENRANRADAKEARQEYVKALSEIQGSHEREVSLLHTNYQNMLTERDARHQKEIAEVYHKWKNEKQTNLLRAEMDDTHGPKRLVQP